MVPFFFSRWVRYAMVAVVAMGGLIFIAIGSVRPQAARAAGSTRVLGYMWSDNIGWIDMNCANSQGPMCNSFGVSIDESSGQMSGLAWSDNIGWVKFNGLSDFPTGSNTVPMDARIVNNTFVRGWARACAGTATGNCSTMNSRPDGWDGWISLKGISRSGVNSAGGTTFTGYGWGDAVVGWVSAALMYTGAPPCPTPPLSCTCGGVDGNTIIKKTTNPNSCNINTIQTSCTPSGKSCVPGSCFCLDAPAAVIVPLTVTPPIVGMNGTSVVSWNVANATCYVTGTNNDGTSDSTDANSPGIWQSTGEGLNSVVTSGIVARTGYTLTCPSTTIAPQTVWVSIAPQFNER